MSVTLLHGGWFKELWDLWGHLSLSSPGGVIVMGSK